MLTHTQQRQLEAIDAEFARRGIKVKTTITSTPIEQHRWGVEGAITLALDERDRMDKWATCLFETYHNIIDFKIGNTSEYTMAMFNRSGVYGVAICAARDKYDEDFGAFVAKARFLKHIKENERGKHNG